MELYVIANLHNQTVLGKKGAWISTANSKSTLRNVCWFDSLTVAKKACIPYNPNTVVVLTAKNLCKRIGIKKIPSYIQENYRGSVLSRTMRIDAIELEAPPIASDRGEHLEVDHAGNRKMVNEISQVEKGACSTGRKSRYLELSGCDPAVMQADEISNIQRALATILDISKTWKERQETILELLKQVEARERDLLHIIEFYNLKREQAESAIQELHIVRCQRRQLKNEFTALTAAIRVIVNVSSTSIESASKSIERLNSQTYCCRTITQNSLPGWLRELIGGAEKV